MTIVPTPLAGMVEIHGESRADSRGRFTRLFCEQAFGPVRQSLHFTQVNLSQTAKRGTVRGMHFQKPPAAEAKLVRCLRGRVFDVAIDLRNGSPTFLQWHAVELAGDKDCAVFIPEGMAHGFLTLTDDVEMLYMHTTSWTPSAEAGLRYDDPRLAIAWPEPIGVVSERDRAFEWVGPAYPGVKL